MYLYNNLLLFTNKLPAAALIGGRHLIRGNTVLKFVRCRMLKESGYKVVFLFTFGIQATLQDGIALTLGEFRSFSESDFPSNVQPSNCRPPI